MRATSSPNERNMEANHLNCTKMIDRIQFIFIYTGGPQIETID
jgi:hypothetical protein